MIEANAGDEFKTYVSAVDDGGNPQECYTTLVHVVSTLYDTL